MGLEGNPLGVLLLVISISHYTILRYFGVTNCFPRRLNLVSSVGGLLKDLTESATFTGVVVLGGLVPSFVRLVFHSN